MAKAQLITKTVRLSSTIVDPAEVKADQLGLNFNDIVEIAMAAYLGLAKNRSFALLEAVRDYLLKTYPDRKGFPQDVTLTVFKHIRANKKMWRIYKEATTDEDGNFDESARDSLHRRIGKAVKTVLGAKVVGRSLPLDPAKELIRSHALLEPGEGQD